MEIDIDNEFYVNKSMLLKVLNNKVNKKEKRGFRDSCG